MARKAISTRLRFEIFKRDGFRCVYCGATPIQSPLHVDHVEAIANGGSNEPCNMVTACANCNLGKSAVPLDRKALHAGLSTEEQRDHAEQIRDYLDAQRELSYVKGLVVDSIHDYWIDACGGIPPQIVPHIYALAEQWPLTKLYEAIDICARKKFEHTLHEVKYFYGILRRWKAMER